MILIVWLLVGAVTGWLTSIVIRISTRRAVMEHIVYGIAGGIGGGYFIAPLLDPAGRQQTGLSMLVAPFLGAVILLALIKLLRRAMTPS